MTIWSSPLPQGVKDANGRIEHNRQTNSKRMLKGWLIIVIGDFPAHWNPGDISIIAELASSRLASHCDGDLTIVLLA